MYLTRTQREKERGREAAVGGGERDKEGAGGCPYLLFSVQGLLVGGGSGREGERRGQERGKRASSMFAV